ncbi:amidase [Myxococcus phage Mx8]|uniref:p52 n=1 Tax=Myxococcus phage Mx8 TaxID=49964 RepID=Q94MR7_9CAUD|nr:amidase [Myxococcus phage Mx8]AAK94387.1 p52 [Myxococcus phage Mx8]
MMPLRARRVPPPPSIQEAHLPAPVGGLNTVSAGSAMPVSDCLQGFNLIASELGLRSRLGYREWCTGLGVPARSTLPFAGSAKSGAANRLFQTTSEGIWDVSASSQTPTQVLTFGDQTGDAGFGVSHAFVTQRGHFLFYADETNGLFRYSESTDTWTAVAQGTGVGEIDGVNPANIVFVAVFKQRVWLVERDTARAWYLPAGAIAGTAQPFEMGAQFRAGGHLVGLWNWTYDGGAGMDDSLVAISGGGDVAIWQGTDPASSATFGLRGVWSLGGSPPAGRRIATDYGGDVLVLSRLGVRPLSRLVAGEVDKDTYVTAKVSNLFSALMLTRASLPGWSMQLHPEDNALLVTVPTYPGQPTEQLVMALAGRAWFRYRDLPIYSSAVWGGKLYFGTVDGRVCVNDGYVDGVLLSEPSAFTPVQWSLLSAFTNLGSARQKQVQLLRPTLLSESATPSYEVQARYRYDFAELAPVSAMGGGSGTWDGSTWDVDVWSGEYQASQQVRGGTGVGVDLAIAIRGTAVARTVLVGIDILFTAGGLL